MLKIHLFSVINMEIFNQASWPSPIGKQLLGWDFYRLESSKPLFTERKILTVHNLSIYHNTVGIYKLIRTRVPMSLFELFKFSGHIETRLNSQYTACTFIDKSTIIWNKIREKLSINTFDTTVSQLKTRVKQYLLEQQKLHDEHNWVDLNYTINWILIP